MAETYTQDIEYNGTKLTINPQSNDTEVTRCIVNGTDVIHKFVGEQVMLGFSAQARFYTFSTTNCGVIDWFCTQDRLNLTLTPSIVTWESSTPTPSSISISSLVVKERVLKQSMSGSVSYSWYETVKEWKSTTARTINMGSTATLVADTSTLSNDNYFGYNPSGWPGYGFLEITANVSIADKTYTLAINTTNSGTIPTGFPGISNEPQDTNRYVSYTQSVTLGSSTQEY